MFYAGILVRIHPEAWDAALNELAGLEGLEIHQREPATGRVIATVASEALDRQEATIREIRAISGVLLAEPVYAYRDDEDDLDPSRPKQLPNAEEGDPA